MLRHGKIIVLALAMAVLPMLSAGQDMPGKALYEQSCLVCHGEDGIGGMPGVADLTEPNGPLTLNSQQLLRNIDEGVQREGAPMAMPAKGGNPLLSEQDIQNIILYMRNTFLTNFSE